MIRIVANSFFVLLAFSSFLIVGCKKKDKVDLTKAFVKYYGGIKADNGVEVLQTIDGGYVVAGTTNSGTSNDDFIVIKTDAEGNEEWVKTFGGPNYDKCGSIALMPDNGYMVIGTYGLTKRNWSEVALEATKDSTVMVAIRLDASGNKLWENKYSYPNTSVEIGTFGKAIVVNSNGTCLLAGMVDSSYFNAGNIFVNLDLFALIINSDGSYYKVGATDMIPLRYGTSIDNDYTVNAIKAFSSGLDQYLISTSTVLSGENTPRLVECRLSGVALRQFNAPTKQGWGVDATTLYNAGQMARTSDNNYVLVGTKGNPSTATSDMYMIKLESAGLSKLGTVKSFGDLSGFKDECVSVYATNDAGYILLGTTNSTSEEYTGDPEHLNDVLMVKLDNNGLEQWHKVFGGRGNDAASKVIQTKDGGYLICGTIAFGDDVSNSGASNSITLIKVNSDGEISNVK